MPDIRPDLSNWRTPAVRRQAFAQVPSLIPCARIAAAPGAALALPPSPADLAAFRVAGPTGEPLDLQGFLEATSTDGIVVLKNGSLVFEVYGPGMTAATAHILMSATKSVTGLMAGILAGSGLLDVEAPVTAYVPEMADTPWSGATVRQLLDMRSGVRLDAPSQQAYEASTGWEPPVAGRPSRGLHAFLRSHKGPPASHGGPFAYVSANTDLLGWVLERAAGQPFATLTGERLWAPMGAADDAFVTLDAHGAPRTTGGLCATVHDLARLGQLVLEGGARGGTQIIPSAWLDDIAGGGDRQAWAAGEWAQLFPGRAARYRNGWYVLDDDPPLLFAMGIHGQNLFVDRASGLVIAKLSSQDWFDIPVVHTTHRGVAEFRRLLA